MLPKVRRALDQLENVLLEGGQEGRDLAMILSSLRGPDIPDHTMKIKEDTTMPLRSLIFPRLYKRVQIGYFPVQSRSGWGMRDPKDLHVFKYVEGTHNNHFITHIIEAIEAVERMPSEARGPLNILGDTRE